MTLEARFWAKVEKSSGCWRWTGALNRGYGIINLGSRTARAHRVSYEMAIGPIPEGMTLDHLCRNRACVNPAHLKPVTNHDNLMRGMTARDRCRRGHPWIPENTYWRRDRPERMCRACHALRQAERRAA